MAEHYGYTSNQIQTFTEIFQNEMLQKDLEKFAFNNRLENNPHYVQWEK